MGNNAGEHRRCGVVRQDEKIRSKSHFHSFDFLAAAKIAFASPLLECVWLPSGLRRPLKES